MGHPATGYYKFQIILLNLSPYSGLQSLCRVPCKDKKLAFIFSWCHGPRGSSWDVVSLSGQTRHHLLLPLRWGVVRVHLQLVTMTQVKLIEDSQVKLKILLCVCVCVCRRGFLPWSSILVSWIKGFKLRRDQPPNKSREEVRVETETLTLKFCNSDLQYINQLCSHTHTHLLESFYLIYLPT